MPTFQTTTSSAHSRGFTLIEILITIAIIAFVVAMTLPRISNKNNDLRSQVRRLTTLSRELHSRAQLQNATYRLVIDMQGGEDDNDNMNPDGSKKARSVTYWVERGNGSIVNSYDAKNPPKAPKPDDKKEEGAPPPAFSPDPTIMKAKKQLEKGLDITSVELARIDRPVSVGTIYIHYLPSGYVDEAVIHLQLSEKIQWSLATEPLTGRMDIIPENRSLKDLQSK